jgi:hypothetical protein
MFKIIDGRGFTMTFANGYEISVQFGPGCYCQHRYAPINAHHRTDFADRVWDCEDAEIAVIRPDGSFLRLGFDTVRGWVKSDEVAAIIAALASDPESLAVTD